MREDFVLLDNVNFHHEIIFKFDSQNKTFDTIVLLKQKFEIKNTTNDYAQDC